MICPHALAATLALLHQAAGGDSAEQLARFCGDALSWPDQELLLSTIAAHRRDLPDGLLEFLRVTLKVSPAGTPGVFVDQIQSGSCLEGLVEPVNTNHGGWGAGDFHG